VTLKIVLVSCCAWSMLVAGPSVAHAQAEAESRAADAPADPSPVAMPHGSAESDTRLGELVAEEMGKVIGVAMSPAVGLAALGLWQRTSSDRPTHKWYNTWWFIISMGTLALLVGTKDTLGSVAGPMKQIADAAEVLLNNGTGLIAMAAMASQVIEPLGEPLAQVAQTMIDAMAPMAHAAQEGAAPGEVTSVAGTIGGMMASLLASVAFAVVWLVSQTFNVMIMLNPFSLIDPFLKGARLTVVAAVAAACAWMPWLGIPMCLGILLFSFLVSGYCVRMLSFGTVMAWDMAWNARNAEVSGSSGPLSFAGKGLEGVPTRTLGRLVSSSPGGAAFRYRPWLIGPSRTAGFSASGLYAVDGPLYPSLHTDEEGESAAVIDLAPRFRGSSDALVGTLGLAGTGSSWMERKAASAKRGMGRVFSQLRGSWAVLTR
jgi:hypothetical protein